MKILIFIVLNFVWFNLYSQWNYLNTGIYNQLYSVHFFDNNNGIIGGNMIMLRTQDGGQTFNTQPVNSGILDINIINDSLWFSGGYFGNDCMLSKSVDNGLTWYDVSYPCPGTGIYSVKFFNNSDGIGVGVLGGLLYTNNGGNTWNKKTIPVMFNDTNYYRLQALWIFNDSVAVAGGGIDYGWDRYGVVLKTTDKGQNWSIIYDSLPFYTFYAMSFVNDTLGWAVGNCWINYPWCIGPAILKTIDGGYSWQIQYNYSNPLHPSLRFFDLKFVNENVGYVCGGTNGSIMATTDGGNNWSLQFIDQFRSIYEMYFIDENIGFAVGDSGLVLKTTNGGVGWNEMGSKEKEVKVYPNPASDFINIEFYSLYTGDCTIELYDN